MGPAQTTEAPGQKPLVVNGVVVPVGPFEEEGTSVTSEGTVTPVGLRNAIFLIRRKRHIRFGNKFDWVKGVTPRDKSICDQV